MWQADGFTYEREAIEKWLEDHDTSPKTGARLASKMLFPVHGLRAMIREFQEAQAQAQEAQTAAAQHQQQPAWAVFLEPQAPSPPEASTAAAGGSSGVPEARGGRGGRGVGGRGGRGASAA